MSYIDYLFRRQNSGRRRSGRQGDQEANRRANITKPAVKPDSMRESDPEEETRDYKERVKDKLHQFKDFVKNKGKEDDASQADEKIRTDQKKGHFGPEETGAKPKTKAVSFQNKVQSAIFKNKHNSSIKSCGKPKADVVEPANLNNWGDDNVVHKPPTNPNTDKTKSVKINSAPINNWGIDKAAGSSGTIKFHNNGLTNQNYLAAGGSGANPTQSPPVGLAKLDQWENRQPTLDHSDHVHSAQVKKSHIGVFID